MWFNLKTADPLFILPVLAALTQLVLSFMVLPATDTSAEKTLAAATPTSKDDESADDLTQMASSMQNQMVFIMPIMTGFIALKFPSGLALYWILSTLFSIIQQYFVSGWGGLARLPIQIRGFLSPKK
jgi:YidC/Oxa1 family membrane protein insertase